MALDREAFAVPSYNATTCSGQQQSHTWNFCYIDFHNFLEVKQQQQQHTFIMRVKGFMKPADEVITVSPTETIRTAMDLMLRHKVGSVVVLAEGANCIPVGIVTKTDLVKAYYEGITTVDHEIQEIMTQGDNLVLCNENLNRDEAARILERTQNHHAIVIDPETKRFLGLISSWDITAECARDDRAWPWNRSEDGKVHKHIEKNLQGEMGTSPKSAVYHPTAGGEPKLGDSFREYIDNLGYFD